MQDYWKRILNEIIHLKQGHPVGGWGEEELLAGAGGGSEPCLGQLEVPVDAAAVKKRSVSCGDMQGWKFMSYGHCPVLG